MSKTKKFLKSIFIIFVILFFIILCFIVYAIQKDLKETSPNIDKDTEMQLNTYTLDYLNNKYGKSGFGVKKIEKYFSYEGIVKKTHIGYKATVFSSILENNFEITIFKTKPSPIKKARDNFVQTYYNETVNKHLNKIFDLKFDINLYDETIPSDYGRIPTIDELIDLKALDNIYIGYNDNDVNGRLENIKKLSIDLISYLEISNDISYEIEGSRENYFKYDVYITKDALKIVNRLNNKEEYNFSINN